MSTPLQALAIDKNARRHRTRRHPARSLLAAAGLFSVISHASAVPISLINTEYATDLLINLIDNSGASQVTQSGTSPAPLSRELLGPGSRIYAKAAASTFSVGTATSAVPDSWGNGLSYVYARATARTVLNFSPLQDAIAPLALEFAGSSLSFYSEGLVSLYDLTADQSMFSYSWTCCSFQGTVPWEPRSGPFIRNGASIALDQQFLASHDYALTMLTTTHANFDSQSVSIDVSGLEVPEPATLTMVLLALGVAGVVSRRRT